LTQKASEDAFQLPTALRFNRPPGEKIKGNDTTVPTPMHSSISFFKRKMHIIKIWILDQATMVNKGMAI
jgi:hypothetical protein